jgi:hypothetical protein
MFLVEHDLFGKPGSTFPDHALAAKKAAPSAGTARRYATRTNGLVRAVVLGVMTAGLDMVMLGMAGVTMRGMRVMRRLLVIAGFVVLGGFAVMLGGMLVMLRSLMMVLDA